MTTGINHRKITLLVAVPVSLCVAYAFHAGDLGIAQAGLGAAAGLIINPDLDMEGGEFVLWRLLWWPYRVAIPHRSLFSHGPIIGTLGRVAYLYAFVLITCILFGLKVPIPPGWAVIGLMIADTLHALADL